MHRAADGRPPAGRGASVLYPDGEGAQLSPMQRKLPLIEVGYQVFGDGESEEFGAVREVLPGGRPEIVVDIENYGDHLIPLSAVTAVTEQKVMVDLRKLPESVREAVKHAHDAEDFP
jgi:hypothetical protein